MIVPDSSLRGTTYRLPSEQKMVFSAYRDYKRWWAAYQEERQLIVNFNDAPAI